MRTDERVGERRRERAGRRRGEDGGTLQTQSTSDEPGETTSTKRNNSSLLCLHRVLTLTLTLFEFEFIA